MILRISDTSSGRLLPFSRRLSGGIIVDLKSPVLPVVAPSLKNLELLLSTVSRDWSPNSSTYLSIYSHSRVLAFYGIRFQTRFTAFILVLPVVIILLTTWLAKRIELFISAVSVVIGTKR